MKRKPYKGINYLICLVLVVTLALFSHLPIALSTSSLSSLDTPTSTELRGVWLTNVASGVLFAPWGVNRAIARLSQLNFNTLYPVVWNRGHTFYPSDLAKRVTGISQEPLLKVMRGGSDVLAEIVKEGHRRGLSVIPWFEYGFIAPGNSKLVRRHPDWLTQSRDGTKTSSQNRLEQDLPNSSQPPQSSQSKRARQQVWLNPFHPEVQEFIKELILEVVIYYDVDGIQLDDHFGMPVEMGYDPFTIRLYQQEHQGRRPPDDPFDEEWMRWRANKITDFMAHIFQDVKAVKPKVKVSLSPNSHGFSYKNYLQDWRTWVQRGLVDELVLQLYRDDLSSFQAELSKPVVQFARRQIPVSIGILSGTLMRPVDMAQIQRQVEMVRDLGFDGVSFFYWESLWSYMTPDSPQQRRRTFQELFPEPATRPNLEPQ
ncbi:MAG: glycoside hydrolase family 10 protein [Xenococcaceae cyanobacterium]